MLSIVVPSGTDWVSVLCITNRRSRRLHGAAQEGESMLLVVRPSRRLSGHRGDAHWLNPTQRETMYMVYNLSSARFTYNSCLASQSHLNAHKALAPNHRVDKTHRLVRAC